MRDDDPSWEAHLNSTTRSIPSIQNQLDEIAVPGLTVLYHPDTSRVGEVAALTDLLAPSGEARLSRVVPEFRQPMGGVVRPLADRHISRQPIRFVALPGGGVRVDARELGDELEVDGEPMIESRDSSPEELEAGIVLLIRKRIALCLHTLAPPQRRSPSFGLIGESPGMVALRSKIERLASLDSAVLIQGESGTGKELVARALHEASPRNRKPYLCLNMGAIPSSLAVSEIFGAAKGAFSGADQKHRGYFAQADGGTLFMDEIGVAPLDLQALLLRVLETGEMQPLGSSGPMRADARCIFATDGDLRKAIRDGKILLPFFHRIARAELYIPPLRKRRDDIGRLFFFFFDREMKRLREVLAEREALAPAVSAELISRLALLPWSGNVRELKNTVEKLVFASWGHPEMRVPSEMALDLFEESMGSSPLEPNRDAPVKGDPTPLGRRPDEIEEQEMIEALEQNEWTIQRAAAALGISRPSLSRLVDASDKVQKAKDLVAEEILRAGVEYGGHIERMAAFLRVSKQGLRRRMSELGLKSRR